MSAECNQYPISVMFTSKNMPRSLDFYTNVLGFELKECWPTRDNALWASLSLDSQTVMLGAQMKPEDAGKMCGDDAGAVQYMKTLAEEFQKNRPGVGVCVYIMVKDVDAYHAKVSEKVGNRCGKPKTQFYGLRDFGVEDPDGYRFLFYSPVAMSTCQSCGMPLTDSKPGQMYCQYCTDEKGALKPFEVVLAGTAGYFMQSQKMPPDAAKKAAKEHLAKMPAWRMNK